MQPQESKHQYNFGLVGNCSFLAMPSMAGEISWLCWPRFDSSFVFGSLIAGQEKGGRFSITPVSDQFGVKQYYIENTAILATEFETEDGTFRILDCAPRFKKFGRNYHPLMLLRKIELISGAPKIRFHCDPRYDYGNLKATSSHQGSNHLRFDGFDETLRLYTTLPLSYWNQPMDFVLSGDECCILTWGLELRRELHSYSEELYDKTKKYWQNWTAQCHAGPFYQREVLRSAITLKIHQYEDTGAIIAAPTMALPEHPGSGRTWDYRYSWMRDSFYTLSALNEVGKFDELKRYSRFIQSVVSTRSKRVQPLYSITGQARIDEEQLELEGYMGNQPVRVGNQAYTHVQNDVYGQILLSLLPLYVDARFPKEERHAPNIGLISRLVEIIEDLMEEPDAGLWEFRNKSQHHCYTYLFHWAGALAAQKIAAAYQDVELMRKAQRVRELSVGWIERCYDRDLRCYTQAMGNKNLDASLFQLVPMGYINPTSEEATLHIAALEKKLSSVDGLFYRYKNEDDFGETKASFLVCAFWYVEALTAMNRIEDATRYFEKIMQHSNHLGLFSEDIDHRNGSQWGNFPQTYSHVGLINAAARITYKLDLPNFL